ncbi:MAG: hypothetical protein R2742_11235 [Micropruina glycogenica]
MVDGSIEGTYTGTGENLTFTRGKVEGTAKLRHQGESRSLSIEQIAKVLGLSGKGGSATPQATTSRSPWARPPSRWCVTAEKALTWLVELVETRRGQGLPTSSTIDPR